MLINRFVLLIVISFSVALFPLAGQNEVLNPDSLWILPADSTISLQTDTLTTDTIMTDTIKTTSDALDAPVEYQSKDSMVMMGTKFIYLYGEGKVSYKDLNLEAEYIEVKMDSSLVYASYALDSVGEEFGYPIFKEGEASYESKTMKYNFKTKKGYITDVVTEQGEGYVTSGRTKKTADDDLFMVDAKYTTCDEHDHPHFYLALTKAKVKPGKNIVTGPAYLVLEDVPLPIALPFGFFPFSKPYSSGVIMPTYGDEMVKGFCLRDGGYYFAFNDYMDMALTGEIYTKGSWGLSARSTYRKRYKYSGNFNASYMVSITGDKGSADYYKSNDFRLSWQHSQDAKSNPYRRISASVDFTTNSYDQNRATIDISNRYISNTKASTVNITQTFPNNSLTLGATVSVNQQTRDSVISVTLPSLTISYGQTYPFRRKNRVGDPKWYEQIYFSYQGRIQNSITTKDSLFLKSNIIKDWDNVMTHNIPISASFSLFNYLNITPSINFSSNWFTSRVEKEYDPVKNTFVPTDTIYGFYPVNQFSASVSLNTKLYGTYTPWKIFGDKIKTIRHVLTPRVSFTGAPDFGDPMYGYFHDYEIYDGMTGGYNYQYYSPYKTPPGRGKTGSVSFGFDNNIEMKIKSDADSTGERKISIIDNLGLGINYNFLNKEKPWSDLTASLRLKITKSYTFNIGANFDTYAYDENAKITRPRWEVGKGIGRLRNTGSSFSYSFNNEWLKKLLSRGKNKEDADTDTPVGEEGQEFAADEETRPSEPIRGRKKDTGEYDSDGYLITDIPWNLSFNFGLNIGYGEFNKEKREYNYRISKTFGLNGNISPTKGWSFNFSTNYDFTVSKFVTMSCGITRDLHCWQISGTVIPLGPYQSYSLSIAVKSSLLQDLKYNKSSSYRDAIKWE